MDREPYMQSIYKKHFSLIKAAHIKNDIKVQCIFKIVFITVYSSTNFSSVVCSSLSYLNLWTNSFFLFQVTEIFTLHQKRRVKHSEPISPEKKRNSKLLFKMILLCSSDTHCKSKTHGELWSNYLFIAVSKN